MKKFHLNTIKNDSFEADDGDDDHPNVDAQEDSTANEVKIDYFFFAKVRRKSLFWYALKNGKIVKRSIGSTRGATWTLSRFAIYNKDLLHNQSYKHTSNIYKTYFITCS